MNINTTNKKSRSIFSAVLVISVILSLPLGISFMHHNDPAEHSDCLVAILNNSRCSSANALQSFALHANTISRIFTVMLTPTGVLLYALLSLVLFVGACFYLGKQHPLKELQLNQLSDNKSFIKILRWISIHEKRDPWLVF